MPEAKTAPALDSIDWTKKEEMITLWPIHIQEQQRLARQKGGATKTVNIELFDLKKPLTTEYLLQDTTLFLEPNKRQCLFGDHATGKSVLLHAMSSGAIKDFPKHLHVHHCLEIEHTPEAMSVLETVVRAHEFRNILLTCQEKLKALLTAEPAPTGDAQQALKNNLDTVEMHLRVVKSDTAYERAAKMLLVLGFDEVGQAKSTNALSGGLRMRVALCAAFFIEADLLLLDEPTNHLDFPSLLWLENRLRGYSGSFLIISHDRDLLENVCHSVIYLGDKKLAYYPCGFVEFEKRRAKEDAKKMSEIEKFMKINKNVDFSSPKALEKKQKQTWADAYYQRQLLLAGKFTFPTITRVEPGPQDVDATGAPLPPSQISLIKMTDVTFSYKPDSLPFIFPDPISLNITTSTRMGIMGPNGAGKSTTLQLLTGRQFPTTGTVTRHGTADVAYFAQHHIQELNLEQTPIEYMIAQFPAVTNVGVLRSHLSKVGIMGTMADTRMTALSSGQRSCVIFAKITLKCPHLLIMDEPTNFLDMESVDSLIGATNKFTGALLLVSHNRRFLKMCAKEYLSVTPGQFKVFDNLKNCEKATYSFIEDLESGVKVTSKDMLKKPETKTGETKTGEPAAIGATAAPTTTAAPAVVAVAPAGAAGAAGVTPAPRPTTAAPSSGVTPAPRPQSAQGGRGGQQGGQGGRGGQQQAQGGGRGGNQGGGRGGNQGGGQQNQQGGGRGGNQQGGGQGMRGGRGGGQGMRGGRGGAQQ
jgi:ATP-binding cassette subfamily F protein 3